MSRIAALSEKGSRTLGRGELRIGCQAHIRGDVLEDIASCLSISDPKQISHLSARLQRYADRYFAAQQGLVIRLTPGGHRTFVRSLSGRIERLLADLTKATAIEAVRERYKDAKPLEANGVEPSLQELCRQLDYLRQIADDIVQAPPHNLGKKGRPVLDHTVGSLMALFEAMTGERARTGSGQGSGNEDFLAGPAGVALRKVFEAIDPAVTEVILAGCVNRLSARFDGRIMRESDFDWISAIEDEGVFAVSQPRRLGDG
jgi:hypothetical protein